LVITWLSISLQVFAESPFAELPRNHWCYTAIEQLFQSGLMAEGNGFYRLGYSVSRYEMAVWVASALQKVEETSGIRQSQNETGSYTNRGAKYVDIDVLIDAYNGVGTRTHLSPETKSSLKKLMYFLESELGELGYALLTEKTKEPIVMGLPQGTTYQSVLSFDLGYESLLTIGDTNATGRESVLVNGQWGSWSQRTGDRVSQPMGMGFTLKLGDLMVSAGQEVSRDTENSGTTALGLRYNRQNMGIEVGYTSESVLGIGTKNVNGRHITSAGFEYSATSLSRAGAGITRSADPVSNTTTTDFGLRYQQEDASVVLGYRLVDFSAADLQGTPEAPDNVATAEFSIRF
jgi:hypothetical protein